MKRKLLLLLLNLWVWVIMISMGTNGSQLNANRNGEMSWVKIPYTAKEDVVGDYLYVVGGYHSIDSGCPPWGTANYPDMRFIGDEMGTLHIEYTNGDAEEIPLVFGYTMWFRHHFSEGGAPFKTDEAVDEMKQLLDKTLHLYGGFEAAEKCVVKIKIQDKPIKSIKIVDNRGKAGNPVFDGAYIVRGDFKGTLSGGAFSFEAGDAFFDKHVVDSKNPYPNEIKEALDEINKFLLTYEYEYENPPVYKYPSSYKGVKFRFTGNNLADIATGVVAENLFSLIERVDDDGMMHTSYKDAPSWRYDGFGTWVPNANSYYSDFYSRDGGRAIMTLNSYGYPGLGEKSVIFANKEMMYFREKGLTLNGVQIPGHYTVIVNKPLVYSTFLTEVAGWFTRYTKQAFGDEYQNMGNQETDGHGLMMIANYNIWRNLGMDKKWVEDNWRELKEAADFILWCFEHPRLSFAANGLLYAESEGGMNAYTLYCNVPCYLGLISYAEMARAAGNVEDAEKWEECAETIRKAISERLAKGNRWSQDIFGFFHDPVITMMSDIFGYDLNDMPEDWVENSRNAYELDVRRIRNQGHFGPSGIGYDHSMITQNALLLDMMDDANKLVSNLTKLSYAPGLPEPYLVPEGITVDVEKGIIRRQGDLGNLVQLAEALKCYHIVSGVSPVNNGKLKIMPRLPDEWNVEITDFDLQNADGTLGMYITSPKNGTQTAQIKLQKVDLESVALRLGPFPADTKNVMARLNGQDVECRIVESGDRKWAWVEVPSDSIEDVEVAAIYSSTDDMPEWPEMPSWELPKKNESSPSGASINQILIGVVSILALVFAGVLIFDKRRRKSE